MEFTTAIDMLTSYALFAIFMGIIIKLLWDNRDDTRKLSERVLDRFDKTDDRIIQLGAKISEHEQRIYKNETKIDIFGQWKDNIDNHNRDGP